MLWNRSWPAVSQKSGKSNIVIIKTADNHFLWKQHSILVLQWVQKYKRDTHRLPRSCFRLWPCVCKGSTRRWTAGGDDYKNGLRDRKLDSELLQTHISLILMIVAAMILLGQCLERTDQRYFPFLYFKKDTICPWETSPSACETQIHTTAAYDLRKFTKISTCWVDSLWFPHRAVSKADDLYLLICIVVILIQFRDAAHIAGHFSLLFIIR